MQQPAILLTSLLPENTLGLDDWLWGATLAGAPAVRVYRPARHARARRGAASRAHAAGARAQAAALRRRAGAGARRAGREDGFTAEIAPLRSAPFAQRGGPLPTLAWRIEGGGKSVAVSAAGFDPDALVAAARGASLWVHEALHGASLDQARRRGLAGAERCSARPRSTRASRTSGARRARGRAALALVRLRPPPVYAFQYSASWRRRSRGRVTIARGRRRSSHPEAGAPLGAGSGLAARRRRRGRRRARTGRSPGARSPAKRRRCAR